MNMRQGAVREDTREAILDASDRLLIRYGYKKMTMDDLAQEAGIGKGTIYLYFRSKEEVALSGADRVNARILESLLQIARADATPVDRIREMLVQRVLLRFDAVQPFARSLDDIFLSLRTAFNARREKWLATEAEIFSEVLAEGTLLGAFGVSDPPTSAATLLLATNALMPFHLSPQALGARDVVEERASRLAELLLRGLLKRS